MKATDAKFTEQKNKQANVPIWLYTIFDYDGNSNNLCLAEWHS